MKGPAPLGVSARRPLIIGCGSVTALVRPNRERRPEPRQAAGLRRVRRPLANGESRAGGHGERSHWALVAKGKGRREARREALLHPRANIEARLETRLAYRH